MKIKRCKCGEGYKLLLIIQQVVPKGFYVRCEGCFEETYVYDLKRGAVKAWNLGETLSSRRKNEN